MRRLVAGLMQKALKTASKAVRQAPSERFIRAAAEAPPRHAPESSRYAQASHALLHPKLYQSL